MKTELKLKLTKREKDAADWAYWPMLEVGETIPEEYGYTKSQVPIVQGGYLILTEANDDAIEDLIYRIGTQLYEMAIEQGSSDGRGNKRAYAGMCSRLAMKIEDKWQLSGE